MPADNSIYDANAVGWWEENNFLHLLETGINPVRFEFFRKVINKNFLDPASLMVFDIGCGGGFLSEEFARLGCSVTGLDLSAASLQTAANHARMEKLDITYLLGTAGGLPVSDNSFDIAVCCDVLEHLDNLELAVTEASRILKPGGLFFFDTINRTLQSYFETILIGQELPFTRFFAPATHDWNQFITPAELKTACKQSGLSLKEIRGFQPAISKLKITFAIIRLKFGKITFAEFGRQLNFKQCNSLSGSYLGYCTKNG